MAGIGQFHSKKSGDIKPYRVIPEAVRRVADLSPKPEFAPDFSSVPID